MLVALWPAASLAADFVGAETCKACHPLAYEVWKEGPHARAQDSLTPAQQRDPHCASCHAPDLDKGVSGVSCENCHGGGRIYAQAYVMRDRELSRAVGLVDPTEKSCNACHTDAAPSLSKFSYATKMPLIEHSGDRAAHR